MSDTNTDKNLSYFSPDDGSIITVLELLSQSHCIFARKPAAKKLQQQLDKVADNDKVA